jgi:hypothetical protein
VLHVRHALLVSLQDTGYPLKSICEWIWLFRLSCDVRYRQTSRSLIQDQFPRVNDFGQLLQKRFNSACIRDQIVYDLGPRLVQALIPDARREEFDRVLETFGSFSDVVGTLVEHGLAKPCLYEIHLVYKTEDLGSGTAFVQGADNVGVGDDVGRELARFDIEDKDEDGHGAEDVVARLGEVVLDKTILTADCQLEIIAQSIRLAAYPPQSHKFNMRLPMNLMLLCSTSMVAPSLRTSLAT